MRAKPKNNLVFKETCGLWKHKISFEEKNPLLAMLAENPLVEGEKLQAVCDLRDIQTCMCSLKCKCLWRGRFLANLAYFDS